MRYVEVDGLRLSAIGLGTWQFGSREWRYGEAYAADVAPALVRRALELGVTLFDTAEAYGFGRSERILGEALRGHHDGVVLATKLVPLLPLPSVVAWQADGSRRRLGRDVLDLYQLHFPNPVVSARTLMRPLRDLQAAGLVRAVGVSNFSLSRWRSAEAALGQPIRTNQVRFSLGAPLPRYELVPYARENGRVLIAYSPLAQGMLSATFSDGAGPRDVRARNRLFSPSGRRHARPLLEALRGVATSHGATPAQVALAWLLGHGNVVAIPGARTLAQLEENVAAVDLQLSPGEDDDLTGLAMVASARVGR